MESVSFSGILTLGWLRAKDFFNSVKNDASSIFALKEKYSSKLFRSTRLSTFPTIGKILLVISTTSEGELLFLLATTVSIASSAIDSSMVSLFELGLIDEMPVVSPDRGLHKLFPLKGLFVGDEGRGYSDEIRSWYGKLKSIEKSINRQMIEGDKTLSLFLSSRVIFFIIKGHYPNKSAEVRTV